MLGEVAGARAGLLVRRRLTERLRGLFETHPVVALLGPAGQGKTVLAQQYALRHCGPVAWLSLTLRERDPVRLLSFLHGELARQLDRFGSAALEGMLQAGEVDPSDLEVPLRHLRVALERLIAQRPLVVLDDVHRLDGANSACTVLRMILESPKAGIKWLLCARPPLPDDLLPGDGLPVFIDADELRFDANEVEALYREIFCEPVTLTQVQHLLDETNGHPLALAMSRFGLLGKDSLRQELLRSLAPEDAELLMRLALLPRADMALLRDLLGADAPARISAMARHIPGLTPQPGHGAHVLHDTVRAWFEEAARDHFHESERRRFLHRAAEHMARRGDVVDAIRLHLDSGECERAARMLEHAGARLLGQGLHATCQEFLSRLPAERIKGSPRLLLIEGAARAVSGDVEAQKILARAMDLARRHGDAVTELMALLRILEYEGGVGGGFHHVESLTKRAETLGRQLGDELTPAAKAWMHCILGASHQLGLGDYERANAHLRQAKPLVQRYGLVNLQALVAYMFSQGHMAKGEFDSARGYLEELDRLQNTGRLCNLYRHLFAIAACNWLLLTSEYELMVELADAALHATTRRSDAPTVLMQTYLARWKAESLLALGRESAALETIDQALSRIPPQRFHYLECQLLQLSALAASAVGATRRAANDAERAAKLRAPFRREPHQQSYHALFLGAAWLMLGDNERAARHLKEAERLARRLDKRHVLAAARLYLGLVSERAGQAEEADRRFESAQALLRHHSYGHIVASTPQLLLDALASGLRHGMTAEVVMPLAVNLWRGVDDNGRLVPLLRARTLGRLELTDRLGHALGGTRMSATQRNLFAILLSRPGYQISHAEAQAILYQESPLKKARASLDTLLSRTRRLLDTQFGEGSGRRHIDVCNGIIRLRHVAASHETFEQGVRFVRDALRRRHGWEVGAFGPRTLLKHYGGPFVPEVKGVDAVDAERMRLHELHRQLLRDVVAFLSDAGKGRAARDLFRLAAPLHAGDPELEADVHIRYPINRPPSDPGRARSCP